LVSPVKPAQQKRVEIIEERLAPLLHEVERQPWKGPTMLPVVLLTMLTLSSSAAPARQDFHTRRVEFELKHELLMLSRYDVFDWLHFEVLDDGRVRLGGSVRNAFLKDQAERAAKKVEGIEDVVNDIEILPVSTSDDRLRLAVYRSMFRDTPLERYAHRSLNPIHIIVKGGRVRLEGVVASEMDRTLAGFKARDVPFVFGVENRLAIDNE
jgi:osmotically-inducible protein OsmY